MPIYDYSCRQCGHEFELILGIEFRDDPTKAPCPKCKVARVERSMVYSFRTVTNQASVWPQTNNALLPDDPKMAQKYREKGWLVSDGMGGETVRCESEQHFNHMMKEQKLKMPGDYEKISKSGPSRRKKPTKMKDRPERKRAKEKARIELAKRGIKV